MAEKVDGEMAEEMNGEMNEEMAGEMNGDGWDDQCSKTAVHVLSSKVMVLKLWVMSPNQISCISDTCIKIHNISQAW